MRNCKSFFRTGCRFRLSRPIRSPGCRRFRFRLQAGRCLAGRPEASTPATAAATGARAPAAGAPRQRRRLQHDDVAELGFGAANAAGAMGVSATALAATCVMESNCQNVGASGGGSASGAFQMISSTYTADINGARRMIPHCRRIVSGSAGQMDPSTEAYAASYELRTDALALEKSRASLIQPSCRRGRCIIRRRRWSGCRGRSDSANIAQLTGLSAASLAANGLTTSSTVGDWRQTIINKFGFGDRQSKCSTTIGELPCERVVWEQWCCSR